MLWKISILFLTMAVTVLAAAAAAQADGPVPLKNWSAPLYWQPRAGEIGETTGIVHHQPFGERTGLMSAPPSFPTPPLVYVATTPCRLVDTRDALMPAGYGPPSMAGGSTRTIAAPGGACGVPAAQAYSVTVTVVPPAGAMMRWLTLYPAGTVRPEVATLNDKSGLIINNAAVVPTGTPPGAFDVYVTDATDVIIDINGYYVPPSALALGWGTAASPSLTFGADTDTGLYSTGLGSLAIATGGASRLRVNSTGLSVTGDLDFSNAITMAGSPLLRVGETDIFLGRGASGTMVESNSAFGNEALASVTSGYRNTAIGHLALNAVTSGHGNTAVGYHAGAHMTGTQGNTLVGKEAGGGADLTGEYSVAVGEAAGFSLTSGTFNTLLGWYAGNQMDTGSYNTSIGNQAGKFIRGGSHNISVGFVAGYHIVDGTYNIHIGSGGVSGEDDSATIRIGDSNQDRAFIAGIRGVAVTDGQNVQIDANGQLGSVSSSRRFKQDIKDLSDTTDTLMALRPVRFRYKSLGPGSPEQYGLIAEEVFEVLPALVGRDKDGQIDSVAYDKINTMLLKEVQEQRRVIQRLESRLAALESRGE